MFRTIYNFKKSNSDNAWALPLEPKLSVFPIPEPNIYSKFPGKIHEMHNNHPIKIKKQQTKRVVLSSQSKRSYSVKNLFPNEGKEEENMPDADFFFHNFKKKPSLMDFKTRKTTELEQNDISVFFP